MDFYYCRVREGVSSSYSSPQSESFSIIDFIKLSMSRESRNYSRVFCFFSSFTKNFWAWLRAWVLDRVPTCCCTRFHSLPNSLRASRNLKCSSRVHLPVRFAVFAFSDDASPLIRPFETVRLVFLVMVGNTASAPVNNLWLLWTYSQLKHEFWPFCEL